MKRMIVLGVVLMMMISEAVISCDAIGQCEECAWWLCLP